MRTLAACLAGTLLATSLVGCSANRPILHSERTRHKTETEIKADFYDCRREWFGMGLVWIAVAAAAADAETRKCLEAKGYVYGDPPPQPIAK